MNIRRRAQNVTHAFVAYDRDGVPVEIAVDDDTGDVDRDMMSDTELPGVFPQRKDWMDGRPYVVTDADMSKPWSGFRDGRCFRCHMCGVFFQPGDTIRFVWCNGVREAREAGVHCGNVHVCAACDGPDIYTRLAEHERIGKERYWHLGDAERLPRNPHSSPIRNPRR